jgi:lysylphosphatidylglycerol synthetase-like protein (DUF2156 family)
LLFAISPRQTKNKMKNYITSIKEKNIYLSGHDESVGEYVFRWGNPASIALLDPACKIFSAQSIDGVIGYRMASKYVVVIGDPVCPHDSLEDLMRAFHAFCSAQDKNVIYIATSEQFMKWSMNRYCSSAIECGVEVILNPTIDPTNKTGKKASLLRNKYNQSIRDGIQVKEYDGYDEQLEEAMQEVRDSWLQNRKGPQIYYLQVNLFADRIHKRWFYAEHQGRIIGVLMLNRIDAHHGWVINILMVVPDALTVTSEFLILSALATLRAEECTFLSIGTVPGSQLGHIEGLGFFSQWLARNIFKTAKKIFRLEDRQRYWKKFYPQTKPTYVLFSKARIKFSEIMGIMRALNART